MRTLLQIVQYALAELQLGSPTVALSSNEKTTKQAVAFVIASCDELLDAHDWQQAIVEHTFNTVGGQASYTLPDDCHRVLSLTAGTGTDRLEGSQTPAQWEELKQLATVSSSIRRFRLQGGRIVLDPTPTAVETVRLQYISNKYVIDGTNGLTKAVFSLDSDKTIFHDRLITNFVKLKIMQVHGFDTTAAVQDYNASFVAATSGNAPAQAVSLVPYERTNEITLRNTADHI